MMTANHSPEEARNREIVLDYYTKLICTWDFAAASVHLGDHFIQHNPEIPDGIVGLENWVSGVPDFIRTNLKTEIRRIIVDGDMVVMHTLNTMPDFPGRAIADFFRLEDGKVVEHWDVIQDIPATSVHRNPIA